MVLAATFFYRAFVSPGSPGNNDTGGRQNFAPHELCPLMACCGDVMLNGKRDSADVVKVRILR